MTVTEIRNILETKYDRKEWKSFLQTQFTNNKLNAEDRTILLSDKTLSKECFSLGNYEINEFTKIGIFEVELNDKVNITRNRVALRNLIKDLTQQVAGAMVVFVQGDKWRFSYISKRKVKNKETDKIQDKETAPKRYTYLFGKGEKALTAAIRFDKLIQKQKENIFQFLTLDDFEEAFSVEKLSKEFFKNYKDTYEDFVQFLTGKRYGKKGNKYVEQIVHEPDWQLTALFNKDEKQARDFCKRMMGRLVFLYFIQKKGWLAVAQGKKWGEGNPDYLYDLFKNSKYKDDFYHHELVPLFFKTLNNPDSENESNALRYPYLNGGLFDDSHDKKYNKLQLPEVVFSRMFETFNNYNFTIYEDAPDEHTVAVDPEMLGHIFENLLEDNKDKGAFYTPKEIVHYMCQESLKAYLFENEDLHVKDSTFAKVTIDKIIQQQELDYEEKQYAEKNAYKIIDALDKVKICDPAIGSGAFPMGLLQEIFNAQIYLQGLKGFKKGVSDADIKKHIIEESIYGVDIDAGAVDIARLRFWLSLVVDETVPQPLPNLDFKIVCANTLIPLGKLSELNMEAKANQAVKELEKIRHDFFNVSSEEKLKLERQFKKVQTDLLSLGELATKENFEIYTKLYEFNPFEDTSCSWFDAWWMFGVKDGFDIVIGNPPYVSAPAMVKTNPQIRKAIIDTKRYQTLYQKWDLYIPFMEIGLQLLSDKGVFSMIVPYPLTNQNYALKLRELIVNHYNLIEIVDLNGTKIFENATVSNCIPIISKSNSEGSCFISKLNEYGQIQREFIQNYSDLVQDENTLVWNLTSEKRESNRHSEMKVLGDYCYISKGMVLNADEKTARGQFVKDDLISESFDDIHCRKYIEAKDIERYNVKKIRYLEYNTQRCPDKLSRPTFRELYEQPKLLLNCLGAISVAWDNGEKYLHNHSLYCAVLWKDLNDVDNKSIANSIKRYSNYSREEMVTFSEEIDLRYLLGVLNSRYASVLLSNLRGGDYHIYPEHMRNLPIPLISIEKQSAYVVLVDYLHFLYNKKNSQIISHTDNIRIASHIEEVLNMMVYELYFEVHMKEVGLDVLLYIGEIIKAINKKSIEDQINDFYLWLQTPNNHVRQRVNIVDIKSPDLLSKINLATQ